MSAESMQALIEARSIPEPNSGCWLWCGARNWFGYGIIRQRHRTMRAHRASYEAYNGPIQQGMFVCHRCDNPCCVNPDHLFAGTPLDNMRDMERKGRAKKPGPGEAKPLGEQRHNAVLTAALVRAIRSSSIGCKTWAQRIGCSTSTVWEARRGITWGHVEPQICGEAR